MKKWENPKLEQLGINKTESTHQWSGERDGQWCNDPNCPNIKPGVDVHPEWS